MIFVVPLPQTRLRETRSLTAKCSSTWATALRVQPHLISSRRMRTSRKNKATLSIYSSIHTLKKRRKTNANQMEFAGVVERTWSHARVAREQNRFRPHRLCTFDAGSLRSAQRSAKNASTRNERGALRRLLLSA